MYKQATQLQLRFLTPYGQLSVEQLWDLKLQDLDTLAVELEKLCEESNTKSFLVKKSEENKTAKLRFDVVLDILTTKVEEAAALADAQGVKEYNQKILGLIASKQDEELAGKSVKDLEKMLK